MCIDLVMKFESVLELESASEIESIHCDFLTLKSMAVKLVLKFKIYFYALLSGSNVEFGI